MTPLAGLVVLDLGAGTAGSVARLLFADAGARVLAVPVDPPGAWDRGTQFVAMDDAGVRESLLANADVVIAGSMNAVDLAEARRRHPRLVTGLVTAYGSEGPLADRATDPESLVVARYGLATAQAGRLPGPVHLRIPFVTVNAAVLLVAGVLAAVLRRDGTGQGGHVETSLLSGLLATTTESFVDGPGIDITARLETFLSRRAAGVLPFYGAYECADGRWLHLGCSYPHFAVRAASALGIGDVAAALVSGPGWDDGRIPSPAVRDALYPVIEGLMRRRPAAEWAAVLEAADVPFAPVHSPAEVLDDPQVRANGVLTTLGQDGRTVEAAGPAIRFREGDVGIDAPRRTGEGVGLLAGLRVLELGNLIAAPLAGRLLADLGAEVIKLEPPDGGDLARRADVPAFHPLNAGKRGIAADLKSPTGRELAEALVRSVDVVVANMRPGALERLGMGPQRLLEVNPGLVVATVSAFGATGPYAPRPGVDGLAAAIAGGQLIQAGGDGRPVQLTGAPHDHTTGLLAAAGILMALVGRARSGRGRIVETSLLDAALLMVAPHLVRVDGQAPPADGVLGRARQYGSTRWERLFETADGWLAIAACTPRER